MASFRRSSVLDTTIASRIMNACWICALPGCFIVQINLLTQVWHQYAHMFFVALIVSSWLAGSALATGRPPAKTRLWGWLFAGCGCMLLVLPLTPASLTLPFLPLGEEIVLAFLSGWCMSAWMGQRRSWPQPVEHVRLVMGAVSGLSALLVVLNMPSLLWSTGCGLLLIAPLLLLDMWHPFATPLPRQNGRIESWRARTFVEGNTNYSLRLARSTTKKRGHFAFLSRRRHIFFTGIASYTTICTGTLWSVAPIAFAAKFSSWHHTNIQFSLLVGVLIALVLGLFSLISPGRGILGRLDRPLPEKWQLPLKRYSPVLILIMAFSLIVLSLPFIQEYWELASIMCCYTLASFFWEKLLPRLRPTLTVELQAHRHLLFHPALSYTLPVLQAQEDRARQFVRTIELCLIIFLVPFTGWLIDIVGIFQVLRATGIILALLSTTALIYSIMLPHARFANRPTPGIVEDLLRIERTHPRANNYPLSAPSTGRS